jgi:hypothetical protein
MWSLIKRFSAAQMNKGETGGTFSTDAEMRHAYSVIDTKPCREEANFGALALYN